MGQRRIDRLWPTPRATRHDWVTQAGVQTPPVRGFVVEWRRHSYRWWALVLTITEPQQEPPLTKLEWLLAENLTPVKSDPNDGRAQKLRR